MKKSGNQEIRKKPGSAAWFAFPDFLISRFLFSLFLLLSAFSTARADKPTDPEMTLVVFNSTDADSKALAKYYADKRKIPADHLVGLDCANVEEISRAEYDRDIAEPLRDILVKRGFWKTHTKNGQTVLDDNLIRYVALMRGVPLKIARTNIHYDGDVKPGTDPFRDANEASVDSELSVLGYNTRQISGPLVNPYYRKFTGIVEANLPQLMLVCRLDGPTPDIVRGMIDDAIETEKNGLWGFAYIDSRNIKDGPLALGDKWLNNLAADALKHGIPVIQDNGPEVFPSSYPFRYVAFYYGWYLDGAYGPFTDPNFHFVQGAVACHIHSFSAVTVRDPDKNWAGPLLSRGASAVLGNVYEPYLILTPNLDIFHNRLEEGFNFAESSYMSQQGLSWMTTFLGDPLYKPFKIVDEGDFDSLPKPQAEFAAYRLGARIWFKEGRAAGEQKLKTLGRQLHSGIIYESLGLLQAGQNDFLAAIDSFDEARKYYKDGDDIIRTAIHEVSILRAMGKLVQARTVSAEVLKSNPPSLASSLLRKISADLNSAPAPEPTPTATAAPTPPAANADVTPAPATTPAPSPSTDSTPAAAMPGTRTPGPWRPPPPRAQTGP